MENIRSLILRLTERCNLHCAYCYAASERNIPDMTPELARQAVARCCPPGGALRIQFTGGEPLLALDTMEAVYAFGQSSGRRLSLAVQTNGVLLSPAVCRRLAAMGCAVGVSLDGLESANALRSFPDGTPAFSAAVRGIRNLGHAGIRCNLTTVVTRANAADLGKLPDLALWLGNVGSVGLDLFRPLGRGAGQELSPSPEELETGLRALCRRTKQIRDAGIPFRLRELEHLRKRLTCPDCGDAYCYAQTNLSLAVDGAGSCWPCSSLAGRAEFLLGSLRVGLPLQPAPALEAPPACRACLELSLCRGGCPARRISGFPDELVCLMHRILREEMEGVNSE